MTILFDVGPPAHVHLFKNLIFHFKKKGYKVIVTSRQKDVTAYLLDHYKIRHIVLSKAKSGILGGLYEFLERTIKIIKLHKKHHFDVAIGTSVSIGYLSLLFGIKSYIFNEDDDDVVPFFVFLAYPFATKIINPVTLAKSNLFKNKRIFYNSYQKLAYLHPGNFEPDLKVLTKYRLKPYSYVLLRLSQLKAHHDLQATGLKDVRDRIETLLQKKYRLVVSEENQKSEFKPEHIHDIMAYAKMIVTDSQSMSVEGAVLGVPTIRYNSFGAKISVLKELEKKYNLTYGYVPGQESAFIKKIRELLNKKNVNIIWQQRKANMLEDKENLNRWMVNFFNKQFKKL